MCCIECEAGEIREAERDVDMFVRLSAPSALVVPVLQPPGWFERFEGLCFVLRNPGASPVILGQASHAALPKHLKSRC